MTRNRRDSGGWASRGSKVRVQCPKCPNDDATMIESTIYGRTRKVLFCKVCAHDWTTYTEHDSDEDDDRE